ncbi:MAG: DUF1080 domain-containing protein [Ferruginibacter sp.]
MKKTFQARMQLISIKPVLQLIALLFTVSIARAGDISLQQPPDSTIEGRWDLTVDVAGKPTPSWLEIRHSGVHVLIGYFVGASGSARPISKVNFSGGKISFTLPPQWEKEPNDITIEGTLQGTQLTGTMIASDGKTYNWVGVRAPSLRRQAPPAWGKPVTIFNGTDLKGWHAQGENQWLVEGGILRSPKTGSNLISDKAYTDFKLHIEFRIPKESNSGIYLRGRYEVQVADSKGLEPLKDQLGAVYGFIAPSEMVAKDAGEWQAYDITLVGRMVTISLNGTTVICNQEIPGITGGAMDSNEGEPGPLQIQGDHGPVEYRNIVITPVK